MTGYNIKLSIWYSLVLYCSQVFEVVKNAENLLLSRAFSKKIEGT